MDAPQILQKLGYFIQVYMCVYVLSQSGVLKGMNLRESNVL